ncbi:hypothetical protein M9458_047751, partial [Cirrhinus mrigala]
MVERTSKFLLIVVGSVFFMLILYQYVAPGVINFGSPHGYLLGEEDMTIFPTPDPHYVKKYYFPIKDLERNIDFEIKGEDVIVFLHIQKTGGTTFGRHLVQNTGPEEVYLLPSEPKGDLAVLSLLHRLELRLACGLDRAHQLRSRSSQQERKQVEKNK